ncbi:hypothetical protein HanRHA438_Chr15g0694381 [Helianthus annuus]|nr:hypothetical protein HanRHA438_Chr15g0694381 [Helianthus annuus]
MMAYSLKKKKKKKKKILFLDTTVQVAPMAVTCQSYVSNGLTWHNLHNRQA